ncbi:hypothetical protein [Oceanobacillus sp. Castelsardo]|uniref:hypothetical protein n=1 Tax=Oceanobacillus sp. Castelsardo TaxID=1851204 RepID=UPI0018D4C826|nr:hypothetical protein [Oceanobacillus sp. Castelsardo]
MNNKTGLSIVLGFASGLTAALLERKSYKNLLRSNRIKDRIKALDRKLYLEGKKRADFLDDIKRDMDRKN